MTEYEKNCIKWDKEKVWVDVVLLSFKKTIIYDYTIPPSGEVNKISQDVVKQLEIEGKIPKSLSKVILEKLHCSRDDCSDLEWRLRSDNVFGDEWFYGWGTLYRWRKEAKVKAKENINKYISEKEKQFIPIIQKAIVKAFQPWCKRNVND